MFEIGKNYKFRTIEAGEEVGFSGVVEKYEHPLIKLEDVGPISFEVRDSQTGEMISHTITDKVDPGRILNVTSPNFISAIKDED